jgi:selenocysteine lyase/cysteine desulfurase
VAVQFESDHFPIKKTINFQAHCSVSHLNKPAADRAAHFLDRQVAVGRGLLFEYTGQENIAKRFHENFAALMKTSPENISMTTNTSEAISMIANGYPFQPGDQIISYVNEYPANHYPWVVQAKRRGVELILIGDSDVVQEDRPYTAPIDDRLARGWSLEELKSHVTDSTRIIAISHVQFTSGYAADLEELGEFCKSKNIDLVVDAAQSLGCLPVYPEQWNVAAVASAGWKWLLGPVGTGVMYTRPDFRSKIEITMSGADHMVQDTEYLDHTWNPHTDGRKFEYSTVSYALLDGLSIGVEEVFLKNTPESIRDRIFDLQELALSQINMNKYQAVVHQRSTRSGILSLIPKVSNAKDICNQLEEKSIVMTPRDGYIRFAPHFISTESEIEQAVAALNAIE